jgi:hypothetical protein
MLVLGMVIKRTIITSNSASGAHRMKISNRSKLLNYSVGSTAIAFLLAVSSAQASLLVAIDPIENENPSTFQNWAQDHTLGYDFTVTSEVTITALGIFDLGYDGLSESHMVKIWNEVTGDEVASVMVGTEDNANTLLSAHVQGQWVYKEMDDVSLAIGDYTIGAFYDANSLDLIGHSADLVTQLSGVTYGQGQYMNSSTMGMPVLNHAVNELQYFGPGFMYGRGDGLTYQPPVTDVPEPAVIALFGLGLVGMVFARRRQS